MNETPSGATPTPRRPLSRRSRHYCKHPPRDRPAVYARYTQCLIGSKPRRQISTAAAPADGGELGELGEHSQFLPPYVSHDNNNNSPSCCCCCWLNAGGIKNAPLAPLAPPDRPRIRPPRRCRRETPAPPSAATASPQRPPASPRAGRSVASARRRSAGAPPQTRPTRRSDDGRAFRQTMHGCAVEPAAGAPAAQPSESVAPARACADERNPPPSVAPAGYLAAVEQRQTARSARARAAPAVRRDTPNQPPPPTPTRPPANV